MDEIEAFLISKLFKHIPDTRKIDRYTDEEKEQKRILGRSEASALGRRPLERIKNYLFSDLHNRNGWCGCRYSDNQMLQQVARKRLHRELDITRIV
jgi:hypothetical protein